MSIEENLIALEERISAAALRSGRKREEIKLVVVSKTRTPEMIREAAIAGAVCFGENRVQEARSKIPSLSDLDIEWHLVGHLQTNKVKYVLPLFSVIQSVDSLRLARSIDGRAVREDIASVECYLQVNTSGEETKSGVTPASVADLLPELLGLERVRFAGFMTIGPLSGDERAIRESFVLLRDIRDSAVAVGFDMPELSMGMSDDFEMAIEEGATVIRVGRAIFGERPDI